MLLLPYTTKSKDFIQFQILDWPKDGKIKYPQTVIQVMKEVTKIQVTDEGPVVVHCR